MSSKKVIGVFVVEVKAGVVFKQLQVGLPGAVGFLEAQEGLLLPPCTLGKQRNGSLLIRQIL